MKTYFDEVRASERKIFGELKFTNNNVIIVEERNIHTAPSSLTLTEELWRWLRSLRLGSWSRIEEPEWWRHAFSNGYVFADILAHYFPRGIQTHTFDPLGVSSYSKRDNWGLLMKFFKKHRINLTAPEKLLPSDYKNSVSIRKSLRSNRFLCEAAMLATPLCNMLYVTIIIRRTLFAIFMKCLNTFAKSLLLLQHIFCLFNSSTRQRIPLVFSQTFSFHISWIRRF